MAAWTIEVSNFSEIPEIKLALSLAFYFSEDEVAESDVCVPFRDLAEIDRLMQPENYIEWRDVVVDAIMAVLHSSDMPEAAEVNGERMDMPVLDGIDEQWYESFEGNKN